MKKLRENRIQKSHKNFKIYYYNCYLLYKPFIWIHNCYNNNLQLYFDRAGMMASVSIKKTFSNVFTPNCI